MKRSVMEIIEKQIRESDPPETGAALKRLMAQGISEEDAMGYISQAVCIEYWDMMNHRKELNRERFIRNLEKLPELPEE